MGSLSVRLLLFLGLTLAVPLWASPSLAQITFVGCGTGVPCADEERPFCALLGTTGRGVCVPSSCETLTWAACLNGSGTDLMSRFLAGDCDGDLIDNRLEPSLVDLCAGARVVVRRTALAVVMGRRIDLSSGILVAPGTYTGISGEGPFAIACSTGPDCPRLDGLHARCVGLQGEVGACTYGELAMPDDPSCVTGTEGADCLMASPDAGGPDMENYDGWAGADCDRDGIINRNDWRVCGATRVARRRADGAIDCAAAPLLGDGSPMLCGAVESSPVTPDGRFVCDRDPGSASFAVCCGEVGDCPPVRDRVPVCVVLSAERTSRVGACTYHPIDGAMPADDLTCADLLRVRGGVLPDACFEGGRSTYEDWAAGQCDFASCMDARNAEDDRVCDCGPTEPADAAVSGPDAAVTGTDAAVTGTDAAVPGSDAAVPGSDAALSGLDADVTASDGGGGLDASGEPEDGGPDGGAVVFSGSGCRCRAQTSREPAPSSFALAPLALLGLVARRARRARRS